MEISVSIINRTAIASASAHIIKDNTDYTIKIAFDSEWDAILARTAIFIINDAKIEVDFIGSTVSVPRVTGAVECIYFGVYAGNLRTTTCARIICIDSALTKAGDVAAYVVRDIDVQMQDAIADADTIRYSDISEGRQAKTTWANISAKITAGLVTIFAALTHTHILSDISDSPWYRGSIRQSSIAFASEDIYMDQFNIKQLCDPIDDYDAANKCYVDEQIASAIASVDALVGTGVIE